MNQRLSVVTERDLYFWGDETKQNRVYYILKRSFDLIISSMGLIVLLPLFIIVAAAIKAETTGPVLFIQIRVGQNGQKFKMFKFRSMVHRADQMLNDLLEKNEADGPVFKIKNDPRLTRVGRFIRKTSIDELPQLFNVVKGDMSLVGPRPPLPSEVAQYTQYQMQRITVMPGLTCFWQINGRSDITFDEWVEMDLKYIRERNLWLDIILVVMTIPVIFNGRGAY